MIVMLDLVETKRRTAEIEAFASRSENWYIPGQTVQAPGTRPEYVLESGTVRAVFSWTQIPDGTMCRHLSISTMGPNYPNPIIVWTVAHLFGLTGAEADEQGLVQAPAKGWAIRLDEDEHCIVVMQRIPN